MPKSKKPNFECYPNERFTQALCLEKCRVHHNRAYPIAGTIPVHLGVRKRGIRGSQLENGLPLGLEKSLLKVGEKVQTAVRRLNPLWITYQELLSAKGVDLLRNHVKGKSGARSKERCRYPIEESQGV